MTPEQFKFLTDIIVFIGIGIVMMLFFICNYLDDINNEMKKNKMPPEQLEEIKKQA
jgi:hypothetical protein